MMLSFINQIGVKCISASSKVLFVILEIRIIERIIVRRLIYVITIVAHWWINTSVFLVAFHCTKWDIFQESIVMGWRKVLIRNWMIGSRVLWRKTRGSDCVVFEYWIGSGACSKSFSFDDCMRYLILWIKKWLLQLINHLVPLIEASLSDIWVPRKPRFAIQWLLYFRCREKWSFRRHVSFKGSSSAIAATRWRTFDFRIFSQRWLELIWTCWPIHRRLHKASLIMHNIAISSCSVLFVVLKIARFCRIWYLVSFWASWI